MRSRLFGALGVVAIVAAACSSGGGTPSPASSQPAASQPALDRQIRSSDSALQSSRSGKKKTARSTTARKSARAAAQTDTGRRRRPASPPDRRGYVGNRLDMDVASAAQIDSLPGVTPLMAKRIVADRMARGPFATADGLRRVIGVSNAFLKRIDTLIAFSGTFVQAITSDSVIPKRRRRR